MFVGLFLSDGTALADPPNALDPDDPFIFGHEFTFTSSRHLEMKVTDDSLHPETAMDIPLDEHDRFLENAIEKCTKDPNCEIGANRRFSFYRYDPAKGLFKKPKRVLEYWFDISTDSGVVEIRGMPLNLFNYQRQAKRIQAYIFDLGEESDLFPHEKKGGGHISIGTDAFKIESSNNDFLFAFQDDLDNHPELASGILGKDDFNARPRILIDDPSLGANPDEEFRKDVKLHTNRLEVRRYRPQESFAEFLTHIRVLRARIEFIRRQQNPSKFNPTLARQRLLAGYQGKIKLYQPYIEEMSEVAREIGIPLDWERIRFHLPHVRQTRALARAARNCFIGFTDFAR